MIPTLLAMRDFSRMREIITVLTKYGLGGFVQRIRLGAAGGDEVHPDSRYMSTPRRFRKAFEELGPTFVKLGQVLSTRVDIFGAEWIEEFEQLQSNVAPIPSSEIYTLVEAYLGKPVSEVFRSIDPKPTGSASVAQVHKARLFDGTWVAVKVLRPNLGEVIDQDLALMRFAATWIERLFTDGKRLKPREVVAEFDKYLHDELDLMREAANASQLGRQFEKSNQIIVPKVYFDLCSREVMTIEWMDGTPISDVHALKAQGISLKKLARYGVEIFFTQVFSNGFFHADMHPGNILVAPDGRYIALDFGIVGSLTDYDKRYLAINFLAFFNRDYHRVATAHIESGWVPPDTRAEDLEAAVRTVCEPIFNKPLSEISFGLVLMRLFETSRRFNVEIQPQLVLLQKTLLNIEGLGRQLDPELDLWDTAKPFLVKWMDTQIGPRALLKNLKEEAPDWADILPSIPRKLNQLLDEKRQQEMRDAYLHLIASQRQQNVWLAVIAVVLFLILLLK